AEESNRRPARPARPGQRRLDGRLARGGVAALLLDDRAPHQRQRLTRIELVPALQGPHGLLDILLAIAEAGGAIVAGQAARRQAQQDVRRPQGIVEVARLFEALRTLQEELLAAAGVIGAQLVGETTRLYLSAALKEEILDVVEVPALVGEEGL